MPDTDPATAFLRARGEVRLLVQWLAVNDALPALAGDAPAAQAARNGAKLHARFADRLAGGVAPAPKAGAAATRAAAAPSTQATREMNGMGNLAMQRRAPDRTARCREACAGIICA